jgi:hypothetical protein
MCSAVSRIVPVCEEQRLLGGKGQRGNRAIHRFRLRRNRRNGSNGTKWWSWEGQTQTAPHTPTEDGKGHLGETMVRRDTGGELMKINQYTIVKEIGEGTLSTVYLCTCVEGGKERFYVSRLHVSPKFCS